MISAVLGLVTATLGVVGLIQWRAEFVIVLKGMLPLGLLFAGIVGVIMGLSTLSDRPNSR